MSTLTLSSNPWLVREEDCPTLGSSSDRLRFCLQYAVLAPSSHNSQPWLFRIVGDHVDVYADRTRALPVVDPDDRELTISLGAAIGHLRLAIRFFGYRESLTLLPDTKDPDFMARVEIAGTHRTTPMERKLFRAILRRRTNRRAFEDRELETGAIALLEAAAEDEGARLAAVTGVAQKEEVADLIAEGDRVQMRDPRFRRELAAWMHPARSRTHDGIPSTAMGIAQVLDRVATPAMSLVVRTFDVGAGVAASDRKLASGSPAIAVIWTQRDATREWLLAGQALARVFLAATFSGISVSFLSQPIEVPPLRTKLARTLGLEGMPQVLLRLGHGPEIPPTPRRAVDDVTH